MRSCRPSPLCLRLAWTLAVIVQAAGPAAACDICAIYTATELQQSRTGVRLGIAQQISQFSRLQVDGRRVGNPSSEHLTSAITQFIAGYQLHPKLGIQLAAPWIHRDFRRATASGSETGSETGFGDLSLLVSYSAMARTRESGVFRLSTLGGVKLPTGNADRLGIRPPPRTLDPNEVRDRLNENMGFRRAGSTLRSVRNAHLGPDGSLLSGIHDHDLSLGTGSVDPVFGVQLLWTWRRAIFTGNAQYVLRTKGSYDYEFADERTASLNPGAFVLLNHRHSLAIHLATAVESKGKDTQRGQRVQDTALTAVYLGPGLHFTRGSALSLDFALDLPAHLDNSDLQIVPDFRLRAGMVWRL